MSASKPFYGWIIVAATLTVLMTAYGVQYTFGVFIPAIEADLGWSRESLSRAFAIYVFLYGALGLVTGYATDRFGPRPVIAVGGVLLGAGYFALSRVDAPWQLTLWLAGVAAAGMSAAFVPCSATVIRWFERLRGRALGITTMGASLGNMIAPPVAAVMIEHIGWRATYAWLGCAAALVIGLAALVIVREPATMGLRPDGDPPEEAGEIPAAASPPSATPTTTYPWTLAEARRTGAFWLMTLMFFLSWLVIFLPVVHLAPYAMDLGLGAVEASWIVSAIGIGGVLGRPLVGAISDRVGRPPALAVVLGTQSIVFALLPASDTWLALFLEAAAFGFAYGGATTLFAALVGDYYGPAAVGAIVGFIFALAGSAAAFGPWLAGYVVDATGSYDLSFWLGAVSNALACLLVFFLRSPKPPIDASTPA